MFDDVYDPENIYHDELDRDWDEPYYADSVEDDCYVVTECDDNWYEDLGDY